MFSEITQVSFVGDITHVTLYADLAAIILTLGVFFLCSRGIIKDSYEGAIFRNLLLAAFCLSISDAVTFAGTESHVAPFGAMLFQTINELLINLVVFLWILYVNYRMFRSRDYLKRGFMKRMIPLFVIMGLTFINLFFGFLFYIDENHEWHVTFGQALCETVRFIYFVICIIQVVKYKKQHREFRFFPIAGFVIPVIIGTLATSMLPYSLVALGFAIGLTDTYAGIINETSFLDRETGFYNRFYMRYLEDEIKNGAITLRSGMIFRIKDPKNVAAFSDFLDPILPKNSVVLRYGKDTIVMLAEVSDKGAIHMMQLDVEDGLKDFKVLDTKETISVDIDTVFKRKTDTVADFYQNLLKKIG